MLLTGEVWWVGYICHLSDDLNVYLILSSFGQHPYLIEGSFTLERYSFDLDGPVNLSHVSIHLLISLPRGADNIGPFFAFQMFFSGVDRIVSHKKVIKLLYWTGKPNLAYFLLFCLNYLGVKNVDFYVGLIKLIIIGFLRRFTIVLVLWGENFWWQSLLFPESVNDPVWMIVFEPWKDKLLIFFLSLDFMPNNAETVVG